MDWKDDIVEEVRAVRDAYAAQFNYDLERMFEDLKAKEARHPELLVKVSPVQPQAGSLRPD
jgi:undecaprenyl pyrophosphate synthase